MSKRILAQYQDGKREIAVMADRNLLAFYRDEGGAVEAEQVYLGVADRIVKGMEAVFVRLTPKITGFLPFSECENPPRSGDKLLVQVKKPPIGDKAPYLTADVALAGRYMILTPFSGRRAVSQKIQDPETRSRLRETADRLAPPSMGLVMRTESADASESSLRSDLDGLTRIWEEIQEKRRSVQAPGLIKGREDVLSRVLRDEHGEITEILTNDPAALGPMPVPVRFCENPFDICNVRSKLEKSLQRKVWLDCGGYLVIDRTEAMTVVDVNSGKFTGNKTGAENTFLKLNLEAAREIARLMRLRNMGGIVIVDFVDMQGDESREAVEKALRDALDDDPVKAVIHGFTSLGLLEITRKKTDQAI